MSRVTSPSIPRQHDRNVGINIIRGFLILGVVLNHLWGDIRYLDLESHVFYVRFGERALAGEWSRLPTSLLDLVLAGGYLIPSFMMLSGVSLYLSVSRYRYVVDLGAWMKRRFRLLLVPYYFGLMITGATILILALLQMALHGGSLVYQVKHVTLARYDYAFEGVGATLAAATIVFRLANPDWLLATPQMLWFVPLLLQYYIAFPVLVLVLKRLGPFRFLALALTTTIAAKLALIATIGIDSNPGAHINHALAPFRWYEFALGMDIGYLVAHRRDQAVAAIGSPAVTAPLIAGGIGLAVLGAAIDVRSAPIAAIAAPLVITGAALTFLPLLTKRPGRLEVTWPALFLAMCGPLSYALLLANEPLRLIGSFLRVEGVPDLVWWSFLVAYLPLTVLLARRIAPIVGITPRVAPAPESATVRAPGEPAPAAVAP